MNIVNTTEFKTGDTLELIDNAGMAIPNGSICTVLSDPSIDGFLVNVEWLNPIAFQVDGNYMKDRFIIHSKKKETSLTEEQLRLAEELFELFAVKTSDLKVALETSSRLRQIWEDNALYDSQLFLLKKLWIVSMVYSRQN